MARFMRAPPQFMRFRRCGEKAPQPAIILYRFLIQFIRELHFLLKELLEIHLLRNYTNIKPSDSCKADAEIRN